MKTTIKKITIWDIKRVAKEYGYNFFHGLDYFYFVEKDDSVPSLRESGVYTMDVDDLFIGQWERELIEKIHDAVCYGELR